MDNNIIFAFTLTLLAGLATGVGGLLAFLVKRDNSKMLSAGLGFSAGVMLYVSFVEILRHAEISLVGSMGDPAGKWLAVGCFFGGMLLSVLLDKLVPEQMSYHDINLNSQSEIMPSAAGSLNRLGVFTAMAIALHNFPEGLATFIGAMQEPLLGVSLAIAIAIHNIPEGMSVALPIYYATGDKLRAFGFAFLSGLAEPLGGIVGYLVLRTFLDEMILGVVFAAVAGIMVYISLDELLPMARESGTGHTEIYGLMAGMMVMAVSLLLF